MSKKNKNNNSKNSYQIKGQGKPTFLQSVGSRIMCELNDLKRAPKSAAKELKIPIEELDKIINGESSEEKAFQLINKMGEIYPIDHSLMYLLKDDTIDGARFMTEEESKKNSRVYKRLDRNGQMTPYYEYRDTAMSRLSLFKPEWISQIRVVDNADPQNPDMVLNKGHNMHQYGLFVGPVNFYWEDLDGQVHCSEMNTGDSNYITPFIKHSFTNRSNKEFAYIIACTSGCETSRAQKELYVLGEEGLDDYVLDYRNNKATLQLIHQHMKNNMLTLTNMNALLKDNGSELDIEKIFSKNVKIELENYEIIAKVLDLEIGDILFPEYKPEEECLLKYISEHKPHFFPNEKNKLYQIHTLARTSKMPLLRGSIIDVLTNQCDLSNPIQRSLHSYMINFSNVPIELHWEYNNQVFNRTINPNDSLYFKPFVKCAFSNPSNGEARMLVIGISGSIGLQAQRELSTLTDPARVIKEINPWFEV